MRAGTGSQDAKQRVAGQRYQEDFQRGGYVVIDEAAALGVGQGLFVDGAVHCGEEEGVEEVYSKESQDDGSDGHDQGAEQSDVRHHGVDEVLESRWAGMMVVEMIDRHGQR